MCTVCGCGEGETRIGTDHHHHDGDSHSHEHHPDHAHHADTGLIDYGTGPARAHAPGLSQARMVRIEQEILAKNDAYARANRKRLAESGILALNLVSSPGSGKTTLLTRTIEMLLDRLPVAVIEGDQQTANDAERIRAAGAPALQINTGKGCHLDAHMVGHALDTLQPAPHGVLFIENVGNLVCPAAFDLGEAHKVAILSVTEGEDKPLKYPDLFHAADLLLINKIDLLPYVEFDLERCLGFARQVKPGIEAIPLSATSGSGLELWCDWILARRHQLLAENISHLERNLATLKQQLRTD